MAWNVLLTALIATGLVIAWNRFKPRLPATWRLLVLSYVIAGLSIVLGFVVVEYVFPSRHQYREIEALVLGLLLGIAWAVWYRHRRRR
jgi:hypothetical protein